MVPPFEDLLEHHPYLGSGPKIERLFTAQTEKTIRARHFPEVNYPPL